MFGSERNLNNSNGSCSKVGTLFSRISLHMLKLVVDTCVDFACGLSWIIQRKWCWKKNSRRSATKNDGEKHTRHVAVDLSARLLKKICPLPVTRTTSEHLLQDKI